MTAAGASTCQVQVSWPATGVVYPAILDPRWTTTGSMGTARQDHTMTLLANGKVLVTGGRSTTGTTGLATAELYDRTTGTWSSTSSMAAGRFLHRATQLNTGSNSTTSGKVLISGGISGTTSLSTFQLYDPTAGTWSTSGNMNAARHGHTATLLADGKVLAAGGLNGTTVLATAAIYNPASGTGSWAATTGPLPPTGQKNHTAVLLQTSNQQLNNKVLLVGGNSGTTTLSATYLFDPAQSAFSTLQSMPGAHELHTMTVLADGKVLVTGGKNGSTTLNTTAIFDPGFGPGSWSTAGTMTSARWGHTATLLPASIVANGQVLVAGGSDGSTALSSAELFSGTSTWTATPAMPAAVQGHTALLIGSNMVLTCGGINGSTVQTAARLYDASFGLGCSSNSQCPTGLCVNGICCDTACNGGCGACNLVGHLGTCTALSNGTTCRAAASGGCDIAETCNGSSLSCPSDSFAPTTTVCRAALDVCDQAENCPGNSANCPSDAKKSSGTPCADEGNPCTTDTCNGTAVACQHAAGNAGAACRVAAGECDVAETCTGSSATCPVDAKKSNGIACTDDGNVCTTDLCNGSSVTCQHAAGNAGVVCRAAAGICDVAETCTGSSTSCPGDVFASSLTVCRGIAGECDLSETCTGASANCPADTRRASGSPCTDDGSPCTTDICDGTSAACQHPAGNAGLVCRAAVNACDIAETCSGTSPVCTADVKKPDGTACNDGSACTQTDACQSGACVGANPVVCAVADQCHAAGTCDPTSGVCSNPALPNGAVCDDGNPCTGSDTCQSGTCSPGASVNCDADVVAALVDRVMKMEFAADWSLTAPVGILGATAQRTGGEAGLAAVGIQGSASIISRTLPTLPIVTSNLEFDIRLPASLASESPSSYGQASLYVAAPSVGVQNELLGTFELTGLPLDAYQTARFLVPDTVQEKLRLSYTDLTFKIVLNVPQNNTGTYLLDELRFTSAGVAGVQPSVEPGRRPAETIAFDQASGRIAVAPIAGGLGTPRMIDVPAVQGTTSACTADFNGDGAADIVFANPQSGRIGLILRRDPEHANFAVDSIADVDVSLPAGRPGPMVCDDIDGDGDVDFVMSFSGDTLGEQFPTLALATYINAGNGTFSRTFWDSGVSPSAELAGKAFGDFNGDGKPDLVVFAADAFASVNSQVYIFPNSGSASAPFNVATRRAIPMPPALMQAAGPNWGSLTSVDFNLDGKNDLWVLGNTGNVFALPGKGDLTFDPVFTTGYIDVTRLRHGLGKRDIDGDGLPDLIVSTSPDIIPTMSTANKALAALQLSRLTGLTWLPGRGGPLMFRLPRGIPGSGTEIPPGPVGTFKSPPLEPAPGPVGLVKGQPVVSSIISPDGVSHPSILMVAVNGHLVQRVEQVVTKVEVTIDPATPVPFPAGTIIASPESCGGSCGPGRVCVASGFGGGGVCHTNTSTGEVHRTVTVQTQWIWVDHGTPSKTILDGTPAVLASESGSRFGRTVVVRGIDGHAYAIDPDRQVQFMNLPGRAPWIDLGLPAPVANGPAAGNSLIDSGNHTADIVFSQERATAGVRPRFVGSPSVVVGPSGTDAFMMDSLGRLQQIDVNGKRVFNRGLPQFQSGELFEQILEGALGDGSPRAVSYVSADNVRHVEVFVIDAPHRLRRLELQASGVPSSWAAWLNGNAAGGAWTWSRVDPTGDPNGVTFPGWLSFPTEVPEAQKKDFELAWASLRGTPDAGVIRTGDGVTHRVVAALADGGFFMVDIKGGIEDQPLVVNGALVKSPLTFANRPPPAPEIANVPVASPRIVLTGSHPSVMAPGTLHKILRAEGDVLNLTSPQFQWKEFANPPAGVTGIFSMAGFSPASGPAFQERMYAVRGDGTLIDGDVRSSTIDWRDIHREAGTPLVISSAAATSLRRGCKEGGFQEETIFPQWVRGPGFSGETVRDDPAQRPPGSPLNDDVLYANNDFTKGFEADKPRAIVGVVVRSRLSGLDNPFDHSIKNRNGKTVVSHDWNAIIAPDVAHQFLMAEGNITGGGTLDVEWEAGDDQWNIAAAPDEGDLLAVRGRHIFDCGHPPFKTEIHPPTSVAVVHNSSARVWFARQGGPTWYQPADPLLPNGAECNILGAFEGAVSDLDFWHKADAAGFLSGCFRSFQLSLVAPQNLCYAPYEHAMTDILGDNEPLEFDVPLPTVTPFPSEPQLLISGGLSAGAVQTVFNPIAPGSFHVSVAPGNMPDGPALGFMRATTNPERLPGFKDISVEICLQRNGIRGHDHFFPASGVREFLSVINTFTPTKTPEEILIDEGVPCDKDDTDEPAMMFGGGGQWVENAPWNRSPSQCVQADLTEGNVEQVSIRAHGFECDLSCGEHWDDPEFADALDDMEGTVDLAFTIDDLNIYAAGQSSSNPKVFQALSQAELKTTAQRQNTPRDYSLAFSVARIIRGTPP